MNSRRTNLGQDRRNGPQLSRRGFLRAAGLLGGTVALGALARPKAALANEDFPGYPDRFGMLTDTTMCIGCRLCETACAKALGMPGPEEPPGDKSVFARHRRPNVRVVTVVNQYPGATPDKPVFRKEQCMHCNEPACASACLVAALKKRPQGMVTYNEDVCIGCRYCMVACPFSMLSYEYNDALTPAVLKCTMCFQRVVMEGKIPACAEICPPKATIFGQRSELLKIAKQRIYENPGKYVDHVYGEDEVGGTGWLYLSAVPFEQLGLPVNLGKTAYPEFTRDFLLGVPLVLMMWPPLLTGLNAIIRRRDRLAEGAAKDEHKKEEVR